MKYAALILAVVLSGCSLIPLPKSTLTQAQARATWEEEYNALYGLNFHVQFYKNEGLAVPWKSGYIHGSAADAARQRDFKAMEESDKTLSWCEERNGRIVKITVPR